MKCESLKSFLCCFGGNLKDWDHISWHDFTCQSLWEADSSNQQVICICYQLDCKCLIRVVNEPV